MNNPKIKNTKPSVCECGYEALNTPLGTEYELASTLVAPFDWVCGHCKKEAKLNAVCVIRDGHTGWLPLDLFTWSDGRPIVVHNIVMAGKVIPICVHTHGNN